MYHADIATGPSKLTGARIDATDLIITRDLVRRRIDHKTSIAGLCIVLAGTRQDDLPAKES